MGAAAVVVPFGGKIVGIHPARVKKLMISTNINGEKLKNSGYELKYSLEESFKDWFEWTIRIPKECMYSVCCTLEARDFGHGRLHID